MWFLVEFVSVFQLVLSLKHSLMFLDFSWKIENLRLSEYFGMENSIYDY